MFYDIVPKGPFIFILVKTLSCLSINCCWFTFSFYLKGFISKKTRNVQYIKRSVGNTMYDFRVVSPYKVLQIKRKLTNEIVFLI